MEIEWVTTGAAAEALGVTAETVRRYIRTGRLRAQVIGGGERPTFRIRRTDLEAFLSTYARDTAVDEWE
jgi:excisionase family DNA binding protein